MHRIPAPRHVGCCCCCCPHAYDKCTCTYACTTACAHEAPHAGSPNPRPSPWLPTQVDVCKEQVEWAKVEKRAFLRQRIELRLASLYLETKDFQASLGLIGT